MRYLCFVTYDGTAYFGWQKQINEIAAKLESKPQEKKKEVVMIPEPVPPKQEEPTPEEKQDAPEQIQPKSKARTLWDWLK